MEGLPQGAIAPERNCQLKTPPMDVPPRVVVVDDQEDIRECIDSLLSSEGYTVETFSSAKEALAFVSEHGAGLVLADLFLSPEMSGWELAQSMRRRAPLAAIPLVVMSGSRVDQASWQGLEARAFLEKPFDVGTLLGTVARFFRSAPGRDVAA
jgi:CheY-like chemotaxis protein